MESGRSVILTNHGRKRLKERLGFPKSACDKMAQLAYDNGFKRDDARGKARRYLSKLLIQGEANDLRVYGEFIYVFYDNRLITVLNLPKEMRKGFSKE